jgi:hypothetical protein
LSFWNRLFRPVEEDVTVLIEKSMSPSESIVLDRDGLITVGCQLGVKVRQLLAGSWYNPSTGRDSAIARLLTCVKGGEVAIVNEVSDASKYVIALYSPLGMVYGWTGTKTLYEGYITGESYVTLNESGLCMLYCNGNYSPSVFINSAYGWLPVVGAGLEGALNDYDYALFLSLAGRTRVGYESGYYGYIKVVKLIF